MKELNFEQMVAVEGGCDKGTGFAIACIGATLASPLILGVGCAMLMIC